VDGAPTRLTTNSNFNSFQETLQFPEEVELSPEAQDLIFQYATQPPPSPQTKTLVVWVEADHFVTV
jgi:hypothetical protein